jgi:hypothetical protein
LGREQKIWKIKMADRQRQIVSGAAWQGKIKKGVLTLKVKTP